MKHLHISGVFKIVKGPVDITITGSAFWPPQAQNCCTKPFCISCTGTSFQTEERESKVSGIDFYDTAAQKHNTQLVDNLKLIQ